MVQPGSPPGRVRRQPAPGSHRPAGGRARPAARPEPPRRPGWQRDAFAPDDTDADLPPWAGLAAPPRSGRPARPPRAAAAPFAGGYAGEAGSGPHEGPAPRERTSSGSHSRAGRAAAARQRRTRRLVLRWASIAIALCVVGAAIAAVVTRVGKPKPLPYVTHILAGEYKSVPNACTTISSQVLATDLPGSSRTSNSEESGAQQSQCSFSVDKPVFRLLEVTAMAYQPFAAASGNGSASANALDNMATERAALSAPPKKSPLTPAKITTVAGLGQQAFAAYQQEKAAGITSDLDTVLVRERNVLITVELSAQEAAGSAPAPQATLQAGAAAAAKQMLARLKTEKTG